jgi:hypothetical protein
MADANVYQKTAQDKVVILNVRGYENQPFAAPNWLDLRVGFFLSLTTALADDTPTGLAETITNTGGDVTNDRYYIGLRGPSKISPGGPSPSGVSFIGFTNVGPVSGDNGLLVSSDADVGTTNANFWRPANSASNIYCAAIQDNGQYLVFSPDGLQQHFPQDPVGAGGYAVLLGLQLLRDNAQSRTVRVNIKSSGHSADMLYTNTPTLDLLKQTLDAAWPPSKQLGPVTLSAFAMPDSFYFYWPFRNSRLRIHSYGVVKAK